MKKVRSLLFTLLAAVCVVCVAVAFSACGSKEKSGSYGAGEEGFYYYDGANSERYMLSLQSGTYMITANGETAYSGSYSYNEESGEISFTSGDEKFTATVGENALSLDMTGSGYSFKAYKYFNVTYVDENGETIATKSVLNGQSAEELDIEKDGYWFIGWYEDSTNSSEFAFNTSIAGDTFVYGWYIEKNPQATEYVITLDYGDGESEVWNTTNGAVYKSLPEFNGSGENILGWWVSATNGSGELTYKYSIGDVFASDTTLFAVYGGIGASVTKEGITWDSSRAGANVSIEITDESGETVLTANPSSSSGSYTSSDFTALGTGVYTVAVGSDTLTYVVNGLDRVSKSSMDIITNGDGKIISFAPVENASGYMVTIDDGEKTVTEDLGSRTYYNLSSWEMTEDGLTITVTAYADGFVSSVSDEYSYLLKLEKVTLEMSGDDFVWSRVDGALEYEVKIYGEDGDVLESFYTTETSYSLKYYDAGTYTISVKPVTSGYWSEEQFIYGQAKSTIAAPVICDITNYTVSWTEVEGAESYVVMINGTEYAVTDGTTLNFSEKNVPDASSYEISVMAVADSAKGLDSSYSDTITATNKEFKSSVRYEKNTVYWDYDVSATSYVVSVNGTETTIENGNSAEITLNKAGNNEIIVTAYDEEGSLGQAEIDVYAYAVILDPNGATFENGASTSTTIYVAQGDVLNLGEVTKEHANFVSWYTQADYTDGQSDVYEGKGSEVENGSVFTGSRDMYLYAYWSYEYLTVELYLDANTVYDTVQVKYNTPSYVFPIATSDQNNSFVGWFEYANGGGTQFTSYNGEYSGSGYGATYSLYAYFMPILSYSRTTYNGETVYAVSANTKVNVSLFPEIEIPEYYKDDDGAEYRLVLNSNAFSNCKNLEVLNIPDTVLYIAITNDGYRSGTGAFVGCSSLREVNIYAPGEEPDSTREITYFSEDGVLFRKISTSESGDVELIYYPYARTIDANAEKGIETGEYVIPSTVSNVNEVTALGESVTHNVTSILTQVFRDRDIGKVIIPNTVTSIAAGAFYNNTKLTTVVFEEGGTADLTLEDRAFRDCTGITDLTLPSRYTNFNTNAFADCTALENIEISGDSGAYRTENGVVLGNTAETQGTLIYYPIGRSGDVITSKITENTSITKIGANAFGKNTKITSVVISAEIIEIGESAFESTGIRSLAFEGTDNSSDLTIKTRAFYGCIFLNEVNLPSNLTVLEKDAFAACTNLLTVRYDARATGEGETEDELQFAEGAFGSTNYVSTLELGANVPEIDFLSIFGGGNLAKVVIADGNKVYSSDDYNAVYDVEKTKIYYYPLSQVGPYVMPDTVTQIDGNTFVGRTGLTSITIGAGVNTIADRAFSGCTYLSEIKVAGGNTSYKSIDGILYKLEDGIASKLVYCPINNSITEINVEDGVSSIAEYAFEDNRTVTQVTINSSGAFGIGDYAFSGASALACVTLPSGLTGIPDYLFYNCTNLSVVNIPEGVTSIGVSAFEECDITGDLTNQEGGISLPSGLTEIGNRAFYDCKNLAVKIPASVETIGEYAFYQCWYEASSSAEVVFESNANGDEDKTLTIGNSAFRGMQYATKVTIPARVTSMGTYVFYNFGSSLSSGSAVVGFESGSKLEKIANCAFCYANISEIVLPASVTSIGAEAFQGTKLKTVKFAPDGETSSLQTIGDSAFYYVSTLEEVTIPASVMGIERGAFLNCGLTSITIEDGDTSLYMAEECFESNDETSITIPARVNSISQMAFYNNKNLTTVTFESCETLEKKLTSIDRFIFQNCVNLTSVTFPTYLTAICESAFEGCTKLESVTLPASLATIDQYVFRNCTNLSDITFETDSDGLCSLNSIGNQAFYGCANLGSFTFPATTVDSITLGSQIFGGTAITSITLTEKITDIGSAFQGLFLSSITVEEGNTSYKTGEDGQILYKTDGTIAYVYAKLSGDYSFPEGVTTIGDYSFYGQTGMASVTIPSTVTYIGAHAFDGCTNLTSVKFENLESSQLGDNGLSATGYQFYNCENLKNVELPLAVKTIPTYCFCGCDMSGEINFMSGITTLGTYSFQNSKITTIDISNVGSIGNRVFYGCSELTEIQIPEGIQSFGTYVFYGCTALVSVELPSSLISIADYTFSGCSALKTVNIPDNVGRIEQYAFQDCTSLKSLVLPEATTQIAVRAFSGCLSLKEINIPSGVSALNNYVFYNCSSLESITLPSALETIGADTFYGCSSLKEIDFGNYLTKIDGSAFYNCYALESVVIGNNVSELGTAVFRNCTSLTYVYTGYSLTTIPDNTFRGCTSLVTVEFGPVVSSIGANAFDSCTSLVGISLEQGLNSIAGSAFASCTSLESLFIPSSVTTISSSAFTGCKCDIYVMNTENYATTYWAGWDTGFEGEIFYYSQIEPALNDDETAYAGNFWYYGENNEILIWSLS